MGGPLGAGTVRSTRTRRRELEGVGHGSVLAGRYRLEERVRTRADGATWRAGDETPERPALVRGGDPGPVPRAPPGGPPATRATAPSSPASPPQPPRRAGTSGTPPAVPPSSR